MLVRILLPVSVFLLGCSFQPPRVADGTGDDPGASDAGSQTPDGAVMADAGPPPSFAAPVVVPGLASPGSHDDDPTVTADLLELYFSSDRPGGPGGESIWRANRATPADPWGAPTLVTELSSDAADNDAEISADGLTIWIASTRAPSVGHDLWVSTRADRQSAWGTPVRVIELSSDAEDFGPAITPSLLVMAIFSNRAGGQGDHDLYLSTRANAQAAWQTPTPIAELNTADFEGNAFLRAGGQNIVFDAVRPDGLGARDLYTASRPAGDQPFAAPRRLVVLSTASDERDAWFSPDGNYVVFASDRSGDFEIYESSRQ